MELRFKCLIVSWFLIMASIFPVHAQTRAAQTSSARAAYGNPAPFKAHVKKNRKAKKKAVKMARRRKVRMSNEPYRRLPM